MVRDWVSMWNAGTGLMTREAAFASLQPPAGPCGARTRRKGRVMDGRDDDENE